MLIKVQMIKPPDRRDTLYTVLWKDRPVNPGQPMPYPQAYKLLTEMGKPPQEAQALLAGA